MSLRETLRWLRKMLPGQRIESSGGCNVQIGSVRGDFHQHHVVNHYYIVTPPCFHSRASREVDRE